jgi:hypothetical protein
MTKFTTELDFEKYLDSHEEELKILDGNDNNSRITTRQFIQDYLYDSENSKKRFDDKRSPIIPHFGKRSDFSSNLPNFDEKDEKSSMISCHYCDNKFNCEKELLAHSLNTHPGKPAEPDETITRLENEGYLPKND